MRGEYCLYGASLLSVVAIILLVFVNIGQISSGAFTNSIYFAQVNVAAYGNALQTVSKKAVPGLYDTKNAPLGSSMGLRQYYRYGLYNGCGYQKDGSGICNGTIFGYPMEPLGNMLADTPKDYKVQTNAVTTTSDNKGSYFHNSNYNAGLSRAASLMVFVGSIAAAASLVLGVIRARIFFFGASVMAGLSAALLLVGAAMWTALINQDSMINVVKVQGGVVSLGIAVSSGPALYLVWVSWALVLLSIAPYVVACCTFRRD